MIKNGVPFDVAHSLEEPELLAYAILFAKFENGDKEWDWENGSFIDRGM